MTPGKPDPVKSSAADLPPPYRHEPMSRDEAVGVQIAFGLATRLPSEIRRRGKGYGVLVPAEWLRDVVATIPCEDTA